MFSSYKLPILALVAIFTGFLVKRFLAENVLREWKKLPEPQQHEAIADRIFALRKYDA